MCTFSQRFFSRPCFVSLEQAFPTMSLTICARPASNWFRGNLPSWVISWVHLWCFPFSSPTQRDLCEVEAGTIFQGIGKWVWGRGGDDPHMMLFSARNVMIKENFQTEQAMILRTAEVGQGESVGPLVSFHVGQPPFLLCQSDSVWRMG